MAATAEKKDRQHKGNYTQCDVALIQAARDGLLVEFYYTVGDVLDNTPRATGYVKQVDTYFLRVQLLNDESEEEANADEFSFEGWIQKSHLAGIRVVGKDDQQNKR